MSAAAGWPIRSRTTVPRSSPIGRSVEAAWSGWPSQRPLKQVLDGSDRAEDRGDPATVEFAEGSRPAVVQRHEASQQSSHGSHLPTKTVRRARWVWMPGRPLLHRPSTVVGNSGISVEALSRAFVDKAVVASNHGIYISSCPKGQVRTARTAPGSDPRSGIGNQVRWSQGRRARFTGGTRRLRTCSEPKGGRLAGFLPVPSGVFMCPARRRGAPPARAAGSRPVGSRRDP